MDSNDQQIIEQLVEKWHSTAEDLMKRLQLLAETLKHSEQDISNCVNEADVSNEHYKVIIIMIIVCIEANC